MRLDRNIEIPDVELLKGPGKTLRMVGGATVENPSASRIIAETEYDPSIKYISYFLEEVC